MKAVWWIVGLTVVIGLLVLAVTLWPAAPTTNNDALVENDLPALNQKDESEALVLANGRYIDYTADAIGRTGFQTTILFFYAGWCPECRGYDQAISAADLPDGLQILRLNYDDEQDLRQKYGVTIQSSFVRVNAAGDKQKLWNGYGKEKSLDVILENTK